MTASLSACGGNGSTCTACSPISADKCSGGQCLCGAMAPCGPGQRCLSGVCVCDATSCPAGCCAADVCVAPATASSCGTSGAACQACDYKFADGCLNGGCSCGTKGACVSPQYCDAGTCAGATPSLTLVPLASNISAAPGTCTSAVFELQNATGARTSTVVQATWGLDAGGGLVNAYTSGCQQQVPGLTFLPGQSRATLIFKRSSSGTVVVSLTPFATNPHSSGVFTANGMSGIFCNMSYGDCSVGTLGGCCSGFTCDSGVELCCSNPGTACADAGECCSHNCKLITGSDSGTAVCN